MYKDETFNLIYSVFLDISEISFFSCKSFKIYLYRCSKSYCTKRYDFCVPKILCFVNNSEKKNEVWGKHQNLFFFFLLHFKLYKLKSNVLKQVLMCANVSYWCLGRITMVTAHLHPSLPDITLILTGRLKRRN